MNVYLPDELAEEVRAAGLNVSGITQEALCSELARSRTSDWLAELASRPSTGVTHEQVIEAIDAAREELWGDPDV